MNVFDSLYEEAHVLVFDVARWNSAFWEQVQFGHPSPWLPTIWWDDI